MRALKRRLANHLWPHDRRRATSPPDDHRRRNRGLTEHRRTPGLSEARTIGFGPFGGGLLAGCRRVAEEALLVEPVDPGRGGGELDLADPAPRTGVGPADALGLGESVDGLSERVDAPIDQVLVSRRARATACPPRPAVSAAAVEHELAVDTVADAPLERTHRFHAAVTLSCLRRYWPGFGLRVRVGGRPGVDRGRTRERRRHGPWSPMPP